MKHISSIVGYMDRRIVHSIERKMQRIGASEEMEQHRAHKKEG